MAILPDPAASQAILVGAAEYTRLEALPAVENNLTGLESALTDPAIWGLPAGNCTVLRQPGSAQEVLDTLQQVAAATTDTLVVYFAGHGLIDPGNDDELYLALPSSDKERAYRTAVPYSWVRREMQAARVRRKVVILDCCYSGRALGRWMGDEQADLAERLEIDGTCVLTATARTRKALAPPDQRFTAFTGELIATLALGIPDGPELLDMDTLYQHLTTRLRAKSLPQPQRGQLDHGGDIALARNKASMAPPATAPSMDRAAPAHSATGAPLRAESWQQSIDPNRQLTIRGITDAHSGCGCAVVGAMLVWAAVAALLALAEKPISWLAGAGTVGIISLILCRARSKAVRVGGYFLGLATPAIYILTAATFTEGWAVDAWIGVDLFLFTIALGLLVSWRTEQDGYGKRNAERERQEALAESVRRNRWLQDARADEAGSALLDPLADIPAARFASLSEGCFPFLAVAGDRIVLVAFIHWPPGMYTRRPGVAHDIRRDGQPFQLGTEELVGIAAQAQTWRSLLPNAYLRVVVVIQPSTQSRAGRIVLRLDDEGNIAFATTDTFTDIVGSFLATRAYELNVPILDRVLSRLGPTMQHAVDPGTVTVEPAPRRAPGES
jgi:hypothetical protein